MIREVYEELEGSMQICVDKLKTGQCIIEGSDSFDTKIQIASLMQEVAIEMGNCLEKGYNLHHSEVVSLLEKYCEDLYCLVKEGGIGIIRELKKDLELIMPKLRKSVKIKNDELSLVAIIKNEANYIVEWLEYHMMVGVTHFFIYDNDSTDNLLKKIKWYIDNEIVTYIKFSGTKQQLPAYNHALSNYKLETKYMGFIDADEFLVPVLEKSLPEIIDDIFHAHEYVGGIGVQWRTYGTSFHENRVDGLIIENYKYRAEDFDYSSMVRCIKTICNPRLATGFKMNPHSIEYINGYRCISENGSTIIGPWFYDGRCCKLRINHYVTKSKEEYYIRMEKGKADQDVVFSKEEIDRRFEHCQNMNAVYDPIMDKYIEKLRKRVDYIESQKDI